MKHKQFVISHDPVYNSESYSNSMEVKGFDKLSFTFYLAR